jgi:putative endonuclease
MKIFTESKRFPREEGNSNRSSSPFFWQCCSQPCEIIMYYVYVLRSRTDGRFYVGCTANLRKRVAEHNDDKVRSTCYRMPLDFVYYEASRNQVDALRREQYLKTTYGKGVSRTDSSRTSLRSYFTGPGVTEDVDIQQRASGLLTQTRKLRKRRFGSTLRSTAAIFQKTVVMNCRGPMKKLARCSVAYWLERKSLWGRETPVTDRSAYRLLLTYKTVV